MDIALFDFDGTITHKDSLADFIQFAVGKPAYYLGLLQLSPILVAYKLKLISNHRSKEMLISHFFRGWDADRFQATADKYSSEHLAEIVRHNAMQQINWHISQGHEVVIISASMESWLKAWCEQHGLALIATRLEINSNTLSGKFATPNCHGEEKLNRILQEYDLSSYDAIYAYGDSDGDKQILDIADIKYYKHFH